MVDSMRDVFAILLEGSLNPAIFQPRWMAAIGALDEREAEDAELRIVSPAMTYFSTKHLVVQVTTNSGLFRTRSGNEPDGLRDLTVRIFRELPHTPVKSFEIAHMRHLASAQGSWQPLANQLVVSQSIDTLMTGGSLSSIELACPANDRGGVLEMVLEPSSELEAGIYCRTQARFELADTDPNSARDAIDLLLDRWDDFMTADKQIAASVLRLAA